MSIRDTILQKIVQPSVHNGGAYDSIAVVLNADEDHRTCEVAFTDTFGNLVRKKNVSVREQENWFPGKEEIVQIRVHGKACSVEARYNARQGQSKAASAMTQNKSPDNAATVGGFIL